MEKYKEKLLNNLNLHINFIRIKIKEKLESVKILADKSLKELSKLRSEDQVVYMQLRANAQNRVAELEQLDSSPYFMKCEIVDEEGVRKDYFFAKYQFSEESIYSWVSPVASIRFENPGEVSYRLPDGENRRIYIKQKEQYMIVDGKVIFFAVESEDKPRELIYQEHFTRQKSEFILPEIVAQMEKAQDQVIRASHKGPLVISGPAGSGKTTLALHRVAYLTQAPDTAEFYPPKSMIVFVQDLGTKDYFSKLLPGLGINDVEITTFSDWAFKILGLNEYSYVERYGENDEEKDLYEYQKLRALRSEFTMSWNRNIYNVLKSCYSKHFSKNNLKLFERQKKDKKLDRFDLVILLKVYFNKYKKFEIRREYQTFVKDRIVRKTERTPILYSLIIVDEFQNYLSEQLKLLNVCLNQETKATVYVGDIAQQVKLGTIKDLEDVGEVSLERNIRLSKVYRNTKNTLSYIKSLGYDIEIPKEVKEGPIVIERITDSVREEIAHIKENINRYEKGSIGILLKDMSNIEIFKEEFSQMKNIHILSLIESQGVEFDIVFIVGVSKNSFMVKHHLGVLPEHIQERQRMGRDLIYVALTRAITELHVLGADKLKDILTGLTYNDMENVL